jgi:hypothetical protein
MGLRDGEENPNPHCKSGIDASSRSPLAAISSHPTLTSGDSGNVIFLRRGD